MTNYYKWAVICSDRPRLIWYFKYGRHGPHGGPVVCIAGLTSIIAVGSASSATKLQIAFQISKTPHPTENESTVRRVQESGRTS